MMAKRHQAGQPFGVVCLSQGSEVRRAAAADAGPGPAGAFAAEVFHPVGTLATIVELTRPQPGLMRARCVGAQRFRVLSSQQGRFGLWQADVEILPDDASVPVPDDLAFTRSGLQDIVRGIEARLGQGAEADVEFPLMPPHRWDDCGWLANRWSELLPLDPQVKQRFMALDSPVLRLELVADALGQMGFAAPA
jgi:Lon protease-like protein